MTTRTISMVVAGVALLCAGAAQAGDFGFSFGYSRGGCDYYPAARTVVYESPRYCYSDYYAPVVSYCPPTYYSAPVYYTRPAYYPAPVVVRARPYSYSRVIYASPRYDRSVRVRVHR